VRTGGGTLVEGGTSKDSEGHRSGDGRLTSAGGRVGCGVSARRRTSRHGKRRQRGHSKGINVGCTPLKGVQPGLA